MRTLFFGLGLLAASGCGSKSSDADTSGPVFSDGVDDDGNSNADSDADGGSDADADGADADGADADGADADADGTLDGLDGDADDDDTGEPEDSGDPLVEYTLSLELDVDTASAGSPVGYQVLLTAGDEVGALSDAVIESDLVDDVPVDAGELVLELAGTHTLTATVTASDGVLMMAEATLVIEAAALDNLIVSMGVDVVDIGVANTYSLSGTDAYGNDQDVVGATMTASDAAIVVTDTEVVTTVAGNHTLTATADDITGSGSWEVLPGDAM